MTNSDLTILEELLGITLPSTFKADVKINQIDDQGDSTKKVNMHLQLKNGKLIKILESRQSMGLVFR